MDPALLLQHDLDPIRLRQALPDAPGVYLFKDISGRVIYVGKAKSLKKRVLSYFRAPADLPPKTALMMKRVHIRQGLVFVVNSPVRASRLAR